MQRRIRHLRRSDEEAIKEAGLLLDFDEIARHGRMSHEETFIAKWYGIYRSRQKGDHMVRVVIPAGHMTTTHVRTLAHLSEKYAAVKVSFVSVAAWWALFSVPLMLFFREVPLSEPVGGLAAVRSGGCEPERIAWTISGARKVRRRTRVK